MYCICFWISCRISELQLMAEPFREIEVSENKSCRKRKGNSQCMRTHHKGFISHAVRVFEVSMK